MEMMDLFPTPPYPLSPVGSSGIRMEEETHKIRERCLSFFSSLSLPFSFLPESPVNGIEADKACDGSRNDAN